MILNSCFDKILHFWEWISFEYFGGKLVTQIRAFTSQKWPFLALCLALDSQPFSSNTKLRPQNEKFHFFVQQRDLASKRMPLLMILWVLSYSKYKLWTLRIVAILKVWKLTKWRIFLKMAWVCRLWAIDYHIKYN